MPTITLTVDEKVLKKARILALAQGTSVDALLRSYLEQYIRDIEIRKKVLEDILALSRSSRAASRRAIPAGRTAARRVVR